MTHDNPRRLRRVKWTAALLSVIVCIAACEAMLRFTLFHAPGTYASQRPEYYARSLDEYWIYTQLFSASRRWSIGATTPDTSGETGIEFYKGWPISLTPDKELGYVRKAGVRIPCHETTSLGTRGTHDYAPTGRKLVFFGDSFVESAACSDNTLTAKLEGLAGIDTLNYGIGGYGLDGIYLYFKRELPRFDRKQSLFLVGLIQDDLARVLLKVRTSPKPYFTISDDRLVLHTDHIHPESLADAFEHPPERFYLYYFLRGRFGEPVYRSMMRETRNERQQATHALTRLLLKAIADLGQPEPLRLAFVIFPTPGAPFDSEVLSIMRAQGLQVIDLQSCLLRSNLPDSELYAELHPTPLGNDLLARCLVQDLTARGLMP